jgi:hypothetical protein
MKLFKKDSIDLSVIALIAANLTPIIGIFNLGLDALYLS